MNDYGGGLIIIFGTLLIAFVLFMNQDGVRHRSREQLLKERKRRKRNHMGYIWGAVATVFILLAAFS